MGHEKVNHATLASLIDRSRLHPAGADLFTRELRIPLRAVTALPLPLERLFGEAYRPALHQRVRSLYFLGIVTDEAFETDLELPAAAEPPAASSQPAVDAAVAETAKADYEGMVILLADLEPRPGDKLPTRSELCDLTRSCNRAFHGTPVAVLFRYDGDGKPHAALANCERTQYRQTWRDGEKPGRVSLLRDIDLRTPHPGHLRILNDLRVERDGRHAVATFKALHEQWRRVFDTSVLSEEFYRELADWFFWACRTVEFPGAPQRTDFAKDADAEFANALHAYKAMQVIRLITRLLFTWFLKEKGLAAWQLFDRTECEALLKGNVDASCYYKAILQNLFFGTFCKEIPERQFRVDSGSDYGITTRYRYRQFFKDAERFLQLQRLAPFLNCGLFECQDKPDPAETNRWGKPVLKRVDGFSDHEKNPLHVPDELFWGAERELDLRQEYGAARPTLRTVRGLMHILHAYKFTIAENTPLEQDVALDPELLGKVFENLLAAYNPETQTTARKQTGSFYTPREIVDYMVAESLVAYLDQKLSPAPMETVESAPSTRQDTLRALLGDGPEQPFAESATVREIIDALGEVKILDPACGSGAFPMGALHRIVHTLKKLDPRNDAWKQRQLSEAENISDALVRGQVVAQIEGAFTQEHGSDYGRKLYLIENCIYGVDIQPIAVQISKLRFFISLMVDQDVDSAKANLGVRPLPNLETKFVAANTLVKLDHNFLKSPRVTQLEKELADIRHRHFNAGTWDTKVKYREKDCELRNALATELRSCGMPAHGAAMMAAWDPYDQNASATFFDMDWMFGVTAGFDLVIGNPPYVQIQKLSEAEKRAYADQGFATFSRTADLYCLFFELGTRLLKPAAGLLFYITSNKFMRAGYGKALRQLFTRKTTIRQIVDFGELPVFEAGTDPCILLYANATPPPNAEVKIASAKTVADISDVAALMRRRSFICQQATLSGDGWTLERPEVIAILDKLKANGTPLGKLVHGRFYYGIKTGFNEAFVIDQATRDRLIAEDANSAKLIKPWLRGQDIKRWHADWQGLYLINIVSSANTSWPWSKAPNTAAAEKLFASAYPAIYRHLMQWRSQLISREDQGRFFWELRSCVYHEDFDKKKLVYNETSKEIHAFVDQESLIINKTGFIFLGPNLEYILAVLTSKPLDWLYRHEFPSWGDPWNGGRIQFRGDRMQAIVIPIAEKVASCMLEDLVKAISAAKQQHNSCDTICLEAQLDARVAHLYNLTEAEYRTILADTGTSEDFQTQALEWFQKLRGNTP